MPRGNSDELISPWLVTGKYSRVVQVAQPGIFENIDRRQVGDGDHIASTLIANEPGMFSAQVDPIKVHGHPFRAAFNVRSLCVPIAEHADWKIAL